MPEKEKPPAMRVDDYFLSGGIAVFTVKDRVCRASILAISLVFGEGGTTHD